MQLKSSLISFNHHFDSPVIPTERIQAAQFYVAWIFSLPFLPFAEYVPAYEGKTSKNCQK